MKRIFALVIFLVVALCATAQENKLRLAVFDCMAKSSSINEDTKDAVREIISATLVNTELYEIVERSLLEQVLKEQHTQVSGMIDDSQITEIGKIAGANKIVLSTITVPQGDMFILSIKMLDVKTGSIDKQVVDGVSFNFGEMFNKVETMTLKLINADIEAKIREKAIIDSINNAKIQAEKEARLREAAEAKAKAEVEARARAKAEAAAKAKAEAEAMFREEQAREEQVRKKITSQLLADMVYVQGGTFKMGQGLSVEKDEKPTHNVTLSDYYIGKYEVTQAQWKVVMGNNPSTFTSDNHPVENVSWEDVQTFIRKLNQLTGKNFSLPTEAQWEFAARGGNRSKHYKYAGSNDVSAVAYYDGNSSRQTHPAGMKQPNELGLYDMSGNVWEWCSDWYGSSYYSNSPSTNPTGPSSGSSRVQRGGSSYSRATGCRVSNRAYDDPGGRSFNSGFRLVLLP